MTALPKKTTYEQILAGVLLETHWQKTLYDLDNDGRIIYIGRNEKQVADTDDGTWYIWRNIWSDKGHIRTEGPIVGEWDNRSALGWGSSIASSTKYIETSELKDVLDAILIQQRLTNLYLSTIVRETFNEEDVKQC